MELGLEINTANPQRPLKPAATLQSALDIWNYVFEGMRNSRAHQPNLAPHPRLRSLDVNVGSFKASQNSIHTWSWEAHEQQRFKVERSERDDEVEYGVANVTCIEVDDLNARLGTGPVRIRIQERLLEEAQERAEKGVAWGRDTRIDRELEYFTDNDFRMLLSIETVSSPLDTEEQWLSRSRGVLDDQLRTQEPNQVDDDESAW